MNLNLSQSIHTQELSLSARYATPIHSHHCSTRLRRGVDLADGRKTITAVQAVRTSATNHEPGVTLNLVGAVEVSHGLLEEAGSLVVGGSTSVEAELSDPYLLAVERGNSLDLLLEALEDTLIVVIVLVHVGSIDGGVGAAAM